jgi:hypothetical protein
MKIKKSLAEQALLWGCASGEFPQIETHTIRSVQAPALPGIWFRETTFKTKKVAC